MRVSKNSVPANIAGALTGSLRNGDVEYLDVMGIDTTYRAVKALLLATEFTKPYGIDLVFRLRKEDTIVGKDGLERTFIRFIVTPEKLETPTDGGADGE